MKNKIIVCLIIIQFVLIIIPLSVFAGDEQNPEIIDDENDVFENPNIHFPDKSIKSIDILSVWFNENQNESDYLFIVIKVVDLNYLIFLKSTYVVEWKHDIYVYEAHFSTQFLGLYSISVILRSYPFKINLINTFFDKENNLIKFKIPKNLIGNPETGDVLTRTVAYTTITPWGFNSDFELAIDGAPNTGLHGKDYFIKY